jgi:hypothetical protein
MPEKLRRVFCAIGIFATGIIAGILGFLLLRHDEQSGNSEAEAAKIKEEVKHEIENTPAFTLIANAGNSNELRADAKRIANGARERLRDRAGKIISRHTDTGLIDGG